MIKINSFASFIEATFYYVRKYKVVTNLTMAFLTLSLFILRNEVEDLTKQNNDLKIEVNKVKEINNSLVTTMVIYNRNFRTFPFPTWSKVKRGKEFVGQYYNPAYISKYGHSFDYDVRNLIGRTDYNHYPKDIADIYYQYDMAIAITGKPMLVTEKAVDSNNNYYNINVLKWRDIEGKDTLVYGMVQLKKF